MTSQRVYFTARSILILILIPFYFFSTKRSSLPSSTLNQPLRVPISSARSDLPSARIRFPSRGDTYNAPHDGEQRVQRDSKLERYD